MMNIKKFDIYLINFNPARGTMPGKVRPAVVIQTDKLNKAGHNSSIVIPFSSQTYETSTSILRLKAEPNIDNGLEKESYLVIDQLTTIDNKKIINRIGQVNSELQKAINTSLKIILDLY